MGHIEATRELAAGPDALWATVSDPQTWDKWFTVHDKWLEEPPATLTEGARLTAKIVMLGMANKIEWTIESVDAPNSLVLSGTGMAGVKAKFAFTIGPIETGSRFTVSGDFEGALVKGALAKAVEKDGVKQLDKSLDALDALASASA
ncbi:SRPBCC family protein [Mycolicibacterium fortuitum]|uniref:type II toxin-antitoxin system Rv0910 family toxin n=1 Tax=Mycolicibacterium fortuitum TaxID=1766 RepID=UPI0007EB7A0B|nr:SRPBCC family protein [Mycolicibacterium fortuitum]NOQ56702.1 SRPBCC family protein [Mycolicibacterium fortuitum]OBB24695.1 polyketide cyclase [Mycolicibacterium fortuitum]OBI68299.1 polyketide cyclase [Mycolicibacterium fortuitum]